MLLKCIPIKFKIWNMYFGHKVPYKTEFNVQNVTLYQLSPLTHQNITFVIIDTPAQTHLCHPKSTVSIRIYSSCCMFYGFWQMYLTGIHCYSFTQGSFTTLEYPIPLFIPPCKPSVVTIDIFSVSVVLPFPECHIGAIRYDSVQAFVTAFFYLVICI